MLNLSRESRVGEVTWLDGSHFALDGTTYQSQVTDDIKQLVTSRFVVEIQLHIVEDTALFHRYFRFLKEGCDMVKFLS